MNQLPDWMCERTQSEDWGQLPDGLVLRPGRRAGGGPVRRATGAFAGFLANTIADDTTACQPGLLQSIDARFKVIGLVGIIIVATLVHSVAALALAYGLFLGLALASKASFKRMAGVWLFVPLVSSVVMLPAATNVITDGSPVLTIWRCAGRHVGPWRMPEVLTVTDTGLVILVRFVLRAAVCVSFAGLLTCTTQRTRLFQGLRALRVPAIFVALLNMMDRYLSVLIRSAEEIHLAKISRSIAPRGLGQERNWVAAGIGSLFRRTYRLGYQVYQAMISRGYTGEIRLLDPPQCHARDWVFLGLMALFAAAVVFVG